VAGETIITIVGNLTADPEPRFTPSGDAVANFTVAVTPRRFDRQANEWRDGETKFWRCAAWNQGKLTLAENVANTLRKGASVIVQGELETRSYETKEGENRTAAQLRVIAIGKNLVFHAQPKGAESQSYDNGGQASGNWGNTGGQAQASGWGNQPTGGNASGWGGQNQNQNGWGHGPGNEPPF